MNKALPWIILVATATGCSTFERDWRDARDKSVESPTTDPFEGPWEGAWLSDTNAHTGRLRCIITSTGDGAYLARYRANWGGIFRFEYEIRTTFRDVGDVYECGGSADLGGLYGTYCYRGEVAGTKLRATYTTTHDHGAFEMDRWKPTAD